MKKVFKTILIVFVLLAVIIIVALPPVTKYLIEKNDMEWIGRKVEMDKLKINLFTGTLKVNGFKMYESDQKTIFSSFDTLIINTKPYRLFADEFNVQSFYLKNFTTTIILRDSSFNFDDLIDFYQADSDSMEAPEADTLNQEILKYELSNLELADANIIFDNQQIGKETNIDSLDLIVPFIGWNQQDQSEAGLKFSFKNGGYFQSTIHAHPTSGEFDANVIINRLYLDAFYEYAKSIGNINSLTGTMDIDLMLDGNLNDYENIAVSSLVQLHQFEMTDTANQRFIAADYARCQLAEINYFDKRYVIDSLFLNQPYTYFELRDTSNNYFEIFNVASADTLAETTEADTNAIDTVPELYYAIHNLEIENGILDYRDNLTGEPFDYHLSQMKLSADSISSTADWVEFKSTMLLNERGTLVAQLGIDPNNPYELFLDFSVEKFLLPDLNIYTNFYMGHTILEGDMFYYSTTRITNGDIESENKLLVKNPSLNSSRKGLYNLPLKFALFLLKDKNGDVNLDVPVRGDLNDPSINVGKIVWNTFKNLIIKIAASPGKLLASVVGGDPKDLEAIEFAYADTALTPQHIKQLDLLLDLETKKEELAIELAYRVDETLQKEAIAELEAERMFTAQTKKDVAANRKKFETFLMEQTQSDSLDFKKACMQLVGESEVNALVEQFNANRIKAVTSYLTLHSDSSQIKVKPYDSTLPENVGSYPLFKVNFSMKDDADNASAAEN